MMTHTDCYAEHISKELVTDKGLVHPIVPIIQEYYDDVKEYHRIFDKEEFDADFDADFDDADMPEYIMEFFTDPSERDYKFTYPAPLQFLRKDGSVLTIVYHGITFRDSIDEWNDDQIADHFRNRKIYVFGLEGMPTVERLKFCHPEIRHLAVFRDHAWVWQTKDIRSIAQARSYLRKHMLPIWGNPIPKSDPGFSTSSNGWRRWRSKRLEAAMSAHVGGDGEGSHAMRMRLEAAMSAHAETDDEGDEIFFTLKDVLARYIQDEDLTPYKHMLEAMAEAVRPLIAKQEN